MNLTQNLKTMRGINEIPSGHGGVLQDVSAGVLGQSGNGSNNHFLEMDLLLLWKRREKAWMRFEDEGV